MPEAQWSARGGNMKLPSLTPAGRFVGRPEANGPGARATIYWPRTGELFPLASATYALARVQATLS
jgi:hypothetical protein